MKDIDISTEILNTASGSAEECVTKNEAFTIEAKDTEKPLKIENIDTTNLKKKLQTNGEVWFPHIESILCKKSKRVMLAPVVEKGAAHIDA